MKKDKIMFQPSVAIAPGETLLELITSNGITQAELAKRMGRPVKIINEIVKGKSAITPETALQLEQVLGKPAAFWNNLEATYQGLKAREVLNGQLSSMTSEAEKFPYEEISKLGWVSKTSDGIERVQNLLSFFSVTSFENIIERAAFDISVKHKQDRPAIYTWLRQGVRMTETLQEALQMKDFDRASLLKALPIIKTLTKLSPEEFIPKLQAILSDCGVAFVVVESIKNAPVFGSTRWLAPNRALIQLSIRLKWADRFWFSLFHELGHLLYGNKKDWSVDLIDNPVDGEIEERANIFARDALINPTEFSRIVGVIAPKMKMGLPIRQEIVSFAEKLDLHPGIVVGRLQHDGIIPMASVLNKLRVRLEWRKNAQ